MIRQRDVTEAVADGRQRLLFGIFHPAVDTPGSTLIHVYNIKQSKAK